MVPFSTSAKNMRSSEIRRLMKLAADPAIISFAGGMPNNSLFPVDAVNELFHALPLGIKQAAFQYCPTAGYPPLIESLKHYLRAKGLPVDTNDLLITTGAQQGINILARIFIDPGDTILTEYPSFIGAVAAFKSYGARLVDIDLDNDGILIDRLERALKKAAGHRLKMLYLCPCFHNPAGILYSMDRKNQVLELLRNQDIILLEDDPYCELYFDEEDLPRTLSMKAMAPDNPGICYVGSFAKIFGPGMRLGYILAPAEIIEKCELAKQSMDACSPTFTQVLAHAYLSEGKLPSYLSMVRAAYARRAALMLDTLQEQMPENVQWTKPRGGFYIWVTMPGHVDSSEVFRLSLDKGAAFVIGSAFDPQARRNNCFRLAFSHTPEERIVEGTTIICNAVKTLL